MANYVMLVRWTSQGVSNAKDTVKRAEKATQMAESMGGRINSVLWTMGKYDIVIHTEFPNDETQAAFAAALDMQGNISTQTMRGFTAQEVQSILQKIP